MLRLQLPDPLLEWSMFIKSNEFEPDQSITATIVHHAPPRTTEHVFLLYFIFISCTVVVKMMGLKSRTPLKNPWDSLLNQPLSVIFWGPELGSTNCQEYSNIERMLLYAMQTAPIPPGFRQHAQDAIVKVAFALPPKSPRSA